MSNDTPNKPNSNGDVFPSDVVFPHAGPPPYEAHKSAPAAAPLFGGPRRAVARWRSFVVTAADVLRQMHLVHVFDVDPAFSANRDPVGLALLSPSDECFYLWVVAPTQQQVDGLASTLHRVLGGIEEAASALLSWTKNPTRDVCAFPVADGSLQLVLRAAPLEVRDAPQYALFLALNLPHVAYVGAHGHFEPKKAGA